MNLRISNMTGASGRSSAMAHGITISLIVLIICMLTNDQLALAAGRQIKIGIITSLTGPYEKHANNQMKGYGLWASHINAKGGILNRPVKLVSYDDEGHPEVGVILSEKLVKRENADLLFGPLSSTVTYPVSSVAERYRVPMVCVGPTRSSIWQRGYRYIFMVFSPIETFFAEALKFAARYRLDTVGLITENDPSFRVSARGAALIAQKLGLRIVFHEEVAPGDSEHLSDLLKQIVRRKPNVILSALYLRDATFFARLRNRIRGSMGVWIEYSASLPEFYRQVRNDANLVFSLSQWEPQLPREQSQLFVRSYMKRWSKQPDSMSAAAYSAGLLVERAISNANTINKDQIRNQLSELKMMTPFGRYEVDKRGYQVGHKMVVIQWQRDKKKIVSPPESATAKAQFP